MFGIQELDSALLQKEGQCDLTVSDLKEAERERDLCREKMNVYMQAREVLTAIAKLKREETTQKIALVVTAGLQSVLGDPSVQLGIREHQTAKTINYSFTLSGRGYQSDDIRNERGGGVQNLVSFLLTVVVSLLLSPEQTRFFVFDEKFAHLPTTYLEATAALLKELSTKLGCQFLLVTHKPEFTQYADKAYEIRHSGKGISSLRR